MALLAGARDAPAGHVRRPRAAPHGDHTYLARYEPPAAKCKSPTANFIDEATGGRSSESTHLCLGLVLPNPWVGREAGRPGLGEGRESCHTWIPTATLGTCPSPSSYVSGAPHAVDQ